VTRLLLASGAGALGLALSIVACSSPAPPARTPPPVEAAPQLWGDLRPVVSVKELMRDMIDPVADNIFDAVSTIVTDKGVVETEPRTDEDWEKVRVGAVTLAEGIYLLKIPRPFAPPGDVNNSTGPDPEELSPDHIRAKLEKDPVLWNAKIEALRNVGLEVLEIVKKKDAQALWNASEDLDEACENCHIEYWYPGERALFQRLDRHLQDLYESPVRK
jgi:hypothetical protein